MYENPPLDAQEQAWLRRALTLARRGRYGAAPNPMVGAVVVRNGEVVGEGYHRQVGGPHAEVEAFARAGRRARGATLFVSLEPCSIYGRTPPCTEAVLSAGIRRVVACHLDPDPRVQGNGFQRLREAGLEVHSGYLLQESARLNWQFLVAALEKRPAVTLKWAMSLDGRIATATGQSQWISSPAGRRWGLDQRETHDAILVGSGTALADDPRLNRRLNKAGKDNIRVVMDRRLRLSPSARLLQIPGRVLVYTQSPDAERVRQLEHQGAEVRVLPEVSPRKVLDSLWQEGVRSVLVEGGAGVAGAFALEACFDRVAVNLAPLLIGGEEAPGPLGGQGFSSLAEAARADSLRLSRRGGDVVLEGFRKGCLQALCASVAG